MAETLQSYTVPEHHVKMYTANVQAALTKDGGELINYVDSKMDYRGEKAQVINFIGEVRFIERDTPYDDTKLTQLEHTQRWITGKEYDVAVLVDRLDLLKMIYDPTNPYVERFRAAAALKKDEIIMASFFASAKSGKDGTTSVSFPATDVVAHGATAFSVAKLRELRKLMKKRHVKLRTSRPYIAVTADEIDDLLGEVAVGSSDYNAIKPLVDGEVSGFMGFTFVPYEDNGGVSGDGMSIPTYVDTGQTIRQLPAWVKDGMHYGGWQDLVITINGRADKNNIPQIHGTFTAGATRREEGKVFSCEVKIS